MKQVLDFVKAHTFALLCLVVALAALTVYFIYPLPSKFADLQEDLNKRKPVAEALKSQLTQTRTLPIVSLDGGEPTKLQSFPTRRVIDQGNAIVTKLKDEAKQVYDAAVARNQMKPLVPDALPDGSTIARKQFLEAYQRVTVQSGPGAEDGIIHTVLRGSLPPSPDELNAIGASEAARLNTRLLRLDANNQPLNQAEVTDAIAKMRAELPLRLRAQRAFGGQMWVSQNAVDVNATLRGTNQPPDVVTVFNAQYQLWLQQMVFEGLSAANGNAKNIFAGPIKHLVRLEVPLSVVPAGNASGGNPYMMGQPVAATPTADVALKDDPTVADAPNFGTNPLGFKSNAMYDPIPSRITIRVDATKLTDVLSKLQAAKLIRIKNVNLRTVDLGQALADGYVYDQDGKTPLVEVTLDCDLLVLRHWVIPLMPPAAKAYFSTLSSAPATP